MKRVLILSILAGLLLATPAAAAPADPVALVNGEPITRAEFLTTLEQVAGAQILDRLITLRLLLQANQREKLVPPAAVDQEFAAIKGQFPSEDEFAAALKNNGLTEETLRQQVEAKLVLDQLAVKGVSVSEEEIAQYFKEHSEELGRPEEVRASHILVATEDEAKQIVAALAGGADFAQLAAEKSQDPGSKERGGDLGFFTRGEMIPEFEEAAFATKPGELSAPVQSQFGWHVIKVAEHNAAVPATLDGVREQIRELLLKQKTKREDVVVSELRAQGEVKVLWE